MSFNVDVDSPVKHSKSQYCKTFLAKLSVPLIPFSLLILIDPNVMSNNPAVLAVYQQAVTPNGKKPFSQFHHKMVFIVFFLNSFVYKNAFVHKTNVKNHLSRWNIVMKMLTLVCLVY